MGGGGTRKQTFGPVEVDVAGFDGREGVVDDALGEGGAVLAGLVVCCSEAVADLEVG